MHSTSFLCLLAGALPVFSAAVQPLVAHEVKYIEPAERRYLDLDSSNSLQQRTTNLGTFSLAHSLPPNDIMISAALGKSSGQTSGSLSVTATCVSCYTNGTATVTTDGVNQDSSILGDIIDFFKSSDKTDLVAKAVGVDMVVDIEGLGGHFDIDINFAASGTYTVPIWQSETPVGIALGSNNQIGLVMSIEIQLTVSDAVDITTGFDFSFPKGASFTLNPVNGDLVSVNIGDAQVTGIPIVFKDGKACVSALLRVKLQAGVSLEVFGTGFSFESGVFFDPLQYKACVVAQPSASCPIQITEDFFEEIGAFARAVADLDFAKLSVGPTAASTFFTGALPSTCLLSGASSSTGTTVLSTTAAPAKTSSAASAVKSSATSATGAKSTATVTSKAPSSNASATVLSTSVKGAVVSSSVPVSASSKTDGVFVETSSISGVISVSKVGTASAGNHPQPSGTGKYGNVTTFAKSVTIPTALPTFSTDTVEITKVYTITSCAPTVTDCPARIGQLTTEIITSSAIGASSAAGVVSSPAPTAAGSDLTTRTIYSTTTNTITSCLTNVIHCPASMTSEIVQTKTIVAYTTVCPVAQSEFPSALPSAAQVSAANAAAVTSTPIIVQTMTVNPVPLTPLATPIVTTFDSHSPLPSSVYGTLTVPPPHLLNATIKGHPTGTGHLPYKSGASGHLPIKSTGGMFRPIASGSVVPSPVPAGSTKVAGVNNNGIKAEAAVSSTTAAPSSSPTLAQTSYAISIVPGGFVALAACAMALAML